MQSKIKNFGIAVFVLILVGSTIWFIRFKVTKHTVAETAQQKQSPFVDARVAQVAAGPVITMEERTIHIGRRPSEPITVSGEEILIHYCLGEVGRPKHRYQVSVDGSEWMTMNPAFVEVTPEGNSFQFRLDPEDPTLPAYGTLRVRKQLKPSSELNKLARY
ncbi:MAG: hypothetical protein V4526_00610 [Patescibacteria group bacterium]